MAKIKQLNASDKLVTAIVEVDGVMVRVRLNNVFKSHCERDKAVIKKAKEKAVG